MGYCFSVWLRFHHSLLFSTIFCGYLFQLSMLQDCDWKYWLDNNMFVEDVPLLSLIVCFASRWWIAVDILCSEMARKVAEMKMRKKAEKEQQKEMMHRARQLRGRCETIHLSTNCTLPCLVFSIFLWQISQTFYLSVMFYCGAVLS